MQNPFAPKGGRITLTQTDVVNLLGAKEAELMIARGQLQQAAQMLEALKTENAALKAKLSEKPIQTSDAAKTVPDAV